MLFHVLGHVEADQGIFISEKKLGECLGKFGLTHARWSKENERTARPFGVFKTCAGTANSLTHSFNRVLLTDNAFVKFVLHVEEFLGFFFRELIDGYSSPNRKNFGYCFFINFVEQIHTFGFDLLHKFGSPIQQIFFFVTQRAG